MLRHKAYFTNFELDASVLENRWHKGVIPLEWRRHRIRIPLGVQYTTARMVKWLYANTEGRWSLWTRRIQNENEMTIAFELDFDVSTFIFKDGQIEAFKDE